MAVDKYKGMGKMGRGWSKNTKFKLYKKSKLWCNIQQCDIVNNVLYTRHLLRG